ncbi:MAG: tyrosine--tRNA ligase [Acidiferrobacteraceae bacterium]|nr:tyrosine--tRNA ligase [Acidiferrobacteraceae bacterium]|tara:strand:+ start:702 stop:1913 length:1212 start_codon:yes stop_codon:yes gene_type:complete
MPQIPVESLMEELRRGTEEIIPESELVDRLENDRPLRVKVGFDPTAPDLHLGHTVVVNKMRQFQEFGHDIIFLIGDFTGMIGDPSGKNTTRPALSKEEITDNAASYQEQVFKILDPDKTQIAFNSSWSNDLGADGMIKLASRYTVARILERDDFAQRYSSGNSIAVHELLYPLMQGYDSVALKADIEMGGTDQKFNLLVGRELQRQFGQAPQIVLTMPLLEGLDGVHKMSKSLGNYVGITENPEEMFGKLMSISDELMWRYFDLLSFRSTTELKQCRKEVAEGKNPRDIKYLLASEIVARFHSESDAVRAKKMFIDRFQKGHLPDDIVEKAILIEASDIALTSVMKTAGLVKSTSEAIRMVEQGAVRVNGERIRDRDIRLSTGDAGVLQVGKRRFARVTIKPA